MIATFEAESRLLRARRSALANIRLSCADLAPAGSIPDSFAGTDATVSLCRFGCSFPPTSYRRRRHHDVYRVSAEVDGEPGHPCEG